MKCGSSGPQTANFLGPIFFFFHLNNNKKNAVVFLVMKVSKQHLLWTFFYIRVSSSLNLLSQTAPKILTTLCDCQLLFPNSLQNTFIIRLCPSLSLSDMPPHIYPVSPFLTHSLSLSLSLIAPSPRCLSSSFPLVKLKGADKWMDRWIPRSSEGQNEWWSDEMKEWQCVTALSWAQEEEEEWERKKNADRKEEKNSKKDTLQEDGF